MPRQMRETLRPVLPNRTYSMRSTAGRAKLAESFSELPQRSLGELGVLCGQARRRSADAEQLDVEHQRRVRRDHTAGAAAAIAERRRNDERALAADLHAGDALIPAGDHLAAAEHERERLVAIARAVGLRPMMVLRRRAVEPAGVVHGDGR